MEKALLKSAIYGLEARAEGPYLPGIISEDPSAKGCGDCHGAGLSDESRKLGVIFGTINHPDVKATVKAVSEGSVMCHKQGIEAGPFNEATHKQHYTIDALTVIVQCSTMCFIFSAL